MNIHRIIKDLEIKLELYKTNAAPGRDEISTKHSVIANLLSIGEVYPTILDRDVVRGLLEENNSWPTVDGEFLGLSTKVDLEELVKLRVLEFKGGLLQVIRSLDVSEDMPPKLKAQVEAINFLRSIRFGRDNWVAPHVRVNNSSDLVSSYLSAAPNIESYGGFCKVTVEHEDIQGVGVYLWRILKGARGERRGAFEEWLRKMVIASDRYYVFDIEFADSDEHSDFLEAAYEFLEKDESLESGWRDCAIDIALNANRIDAIAYEWKSENDGSGRDGKSKVKKYFEELDIAQLECVVSRYVDKPTDTFLDILEWWESSDRGGYAMDYGIPHNIVWAIVKSERNLYSPRSSFPITQKLLGLAKGSPPLAGILLTSIFNSRYECFLLSSLSTSHVGLIKIYGAVYRDAQRISDQTDYDRLWRDLVLTQALEVYAKVHSGVLSKEDVGGAIVNIAEVFVWFVRREIGYYASKVVEERPFFARLKKTVDEISYRSESGRVGYLFQDNCHIAVDFLVSRGIDSRSPKGVIPFGEWMFLFWCLDAMLARCSLQSGTGQSKIKEIIGLLVEDYVRVILCRGAGIGHSSDDPVIFDELEWCVLFNRGSGVERRKLIFALDNLSKESLDEASEVRKRCLSAVRMHLRLLINLYEDESVLEQKDDLVRAIISLVEMYGFSRDGLSGAFETFSDDSEYSPIRLWVVLVGAANAFSDVQFDELLRVLEEKKASLSCLLKLYVGTAAEKRKSSVLKMIEARDISCERLFWVPEIRNMVLMATNSGQSELAGFLVNYGKENAHESHKKDFGVLGKVIELKSLYEREYVEPRERVDALVAHDLDADGVEATREVHRFKRYLLALAFIQLDAAKALKLFEELLREKKEIDYAVGRLGAHVSLLDAQGVALRPSDYKPFFEEWVRDYESIGSPELTISNLHEVLGVLLKSNDLPGFDRFWRKASEVQHLSYELAGLRCKYLQASGRIEDALEHLNLVRKTHGELPGAVTEGLNQLEYDLKHQNVLRLKRSPHHLDLYMKPTYQEARIMWNEILALNTYQQCLVVSRHPEPDHVEKFIDDNVKSVAAELLTRKGNLQRKKASSTTAMPLDDEDMINDWFVSLLGHRLNYLGWRVKDQSRNGVSSSGISVGEVDAGIWDASGVLISIIEALRLKGFDANVIGDHLDKIAGYNSGGARSVFMVIYSVAPDFNKLCLDYAAHVNAREYKGFDKKKSGCDLREITSEVYLRAYYETRSIKEKDVHFYHYLLDLKREDA